MTGYAAWEPPPPGPGPDWHGPDDTFHDDRPFLPEFATLDEFVEVDEAGADALIADADGDALLPENGDMLPYGAGGAGKTTLVLDAAFHLAAGDDWLGLTVTRPVRVLLVENEGPRASFRRKLGKKRAAWPGSPIGDRLLVLEKPWGVITLANAEHRLRLAEFIVNEGVDVIVAGPVTRLGMEAAGTIQETRDFMRLVDQLRAYAAEHGRHLASILVHHESKAGKVSGAWEGTTDTLLHVIGGGNGHTIVNVQKARWSPKLHGSTLKLAWADGETFTVTEDVVLPDDTVEAMLRDAIERQPGSSWAAIARALPGVGKTRGPVVRDRLLKRREIVNVAGKDAGRVLLDHIEANKASRLYLADDPSIQTVPRAGDGPGDGSLLTVPRQRSEGGPLTPPSTTVPRPSLKGGSGTAASEATPQPFEDVPFGAELDPSNDRPREIEAGDGLDWGDAEEEPPA